jgi:hypothetical protein
MKTPGTFHALALFAVLLRPLVAHPEPRILCLAPTPEWTIPEDSEEVRGLRLGVVSSAQAVQGLDVNLVAGMSDQFSYGVRLSGLANITEQMQAGIAVAPVNFCRENDDVIQVGLFNYGTFPGDGHKIPNGRGAQLGLVNYANSYGVLQAGCCNYGVGPQIGLVNYAGLLQVGAVNYRAFGFLQAGIWNYNSSHLIGISMGAVNVSALDKDSRHVGVQAGLWNVSGRLDGLQAGFVNIPPRAFPSRIRGLQCGLANWSDDIYGTQAGAINYAASVSGVQIGLINYARTLHGVQIGLINWCPESVCGLLPVINAKF